MQLLTRTGRAKVTGRVQQAIKVPIGTALNRQELLP